MTHLRARARRDAKVAKKEEKRMQFTQKGENSKTQTNKNKQTTKKNGEPGRTIEQLVQVSGFAKKEKKTRVSPDGGGQRGRPFTIKARADGGGDAEVAAHHERPVHGPTCCASPSCRSIGVLGSTRRALCGVIQKGHCSADGGGDGPGKRKGKNESTSFDFGFGG